ncbi:MAG: lipopolysaccharide biosynthesis protein [Lacipirellulaceae bacterium]
MPCTSARTNGKKSRHERHGQKEPDTLKQPIDYFSSDQLRKDLKGKTVRGGVVTGVAQCVRIFVGFATIPILARLLQAEDFGLVAMVGFFTNFAAMFVDAGLSAATIQSKSLTTQQATNLFWISALLGACVAVASAILAPFVSWFYEEPRLTSIMLVLSITFLISGLSIQHQAMLKRSMDFRSLAVLDLGSFIGAQIIGISCAAIWRGQPWDYWALVVIPVAMSLFRMLALWRFCHWRPSFPVKRSGTRSLVVFGANLTGFNFMNYFVRNADNLIIGKSWGEEPLGYYERAYKLFLLPTRSISVPLSGLMVSTLSRLVDEPTRYKNLYVNVVSKLSLVTMPIAAFTFAVSESIVDAVLGDGWSDVAPILRVLSLVAISQSIGSTLGWLLVSQGRTADSLRWILFAGPIIVLSFLVGNRWGPLGVAIAYSATSCLIIFPCNVWYTCRRGPVQARDIYRLFADPIVVSTLVAPLAWYCQELTADLEPGMRLLVITGSCLTAVSAFVLIYPSTRKSILDLLQLFRELRDGKLKKTTEF